MQQNFSVWSVSRTKKTERVGGEKAVVLRFNEDVASKQDLE